MEIKFSRHARRRMRLYKIKESTILEILSDKQLSDGEHAITKDVAGFNYPIKIVASSDGETITIITAYPLKKGKKK